MNIVNLNKPCSVIYFVDDERHIIIHGETKRILSYIQDIPNSEVVEVQQFNTPLQCNAYINIISGYFNDDQDIIFINMNKKDSNNKPKRSLFNAYEEAYALLIS